ncbi:MAG: hypothetical protein ACRDPC_13090 [Solirubrobacteraceae bacterium]
MPDAERQEAFEPAENQVGEQGGRAVARALVSAPLGDPVRVAEVLAGGGDEWRAGVVDGLQRTSGNRAVTRMLQRRTTSHARTWIRVPAGGQGRRGSVAERPLAPAALPGACGAGRRAGCGDARQGDRNRRERVDGPVHGGRQEAGRRLGFAQDPEERAKKLAEAALAELKAAGVPEYTIVVADLGVSAGQTRAPLPPC